MSNIFKSKELKVDQTVAKFATVQIEGTKKVRREIDYYNLDAIISVGYRVNSLQATLFRQWATTILKEHLAKGYTINKNCDICKCICALFGLYIFIATFVIFIDDYSEKEKILNVTKPEHKEAMDTNYKYRNYFPNPPHLTDLRSDYYYEHKHGFQKSIHHNYGKHCEDFIYGCCKIVAAAKLE